MPIQGKNILLGAQADSGPPSTARMDPNTTIRELAMSLPPQLLGFDVRLDGSLYSGEFWTRERRAAFLLNEGIDWPLSVDWHAWPSYFIDSASLSDWGEIIPLYRKERVIVADLEELRYRGMRLWASLDSMLRFYGGNRRDSTPGVVIAVWLEHAQAVRYDHFEVVLYPDVTPNAVAPQWSFLGFDVADQYLTSALASLHVYPPLRESFGSLLNEHGLFGSRERALEFEQAADQAFPAFRPFSVYGLYRIPG